MADTLPHLLLVRTSTLGPKTDRTDLVYSQGGSTRKLRSPSHQPLPALHSKRMQMETNLFAALFAGIDPPHPRLERRRCIEVRGSDTRVAVSHRSCQWLGGGDPSGQIETCCRRGSTRSRWRTSERQFTGYHSL